MHKDEEGRQHHRESGEDRTKADREILENAEVNQPDSAEAAGGRNGKQINSMDDLRYVYISYHLKITGMASVHTERD